MAANEALAQKIRDTFKHITGVQEKKMFSGIAFMVNDKLCITVGKDRIMCRVDPEVQDALLKKSGCTTVVMKGKEYKGYVWINESALTTQKQIDYWVKLALNFNPKAKATSKKKTGKK